MYGCYDREPLKNTAIVQSGWYGTGIKIPKVCNMIEIPDLMTKECQYSKAHNDPKCKGCIWQH